MEIAKQRYVIPPKTIHVGTAMDFNVKSTSSPFSNGYDMKHFAAQLGEKVFAECDENDPDYAVWEVFKAHELLLKQHLRSKMGHRQTLKWGEYEILPSEESRFEQVGNLVNQNTDSVILHTKQAIRMWEGNNDKSARQRRWPGIRYGIRLMNELNGYAVNDNPYAQAELVRTEHDLNEVESYFTQTSTDIQTHLDKLAQTGMQVSLLVADTPVNLRVDSMRAYAYRMLCVLMSYDRFVRSVKTLSLKGLKSNAESNDLVYQGGRYLRRVLNDLYQSVLRIRAIKEIRRNTLLQDNVRNKLSAAVRENTLPRIPKSVWDYSQLPSMVYISKKMEGDDLELLMKYVSEADLAAPENTGSPK